MTVFDPITRLSCLRRFRLPLFAGILAALMGCVTKEFSYATAVSGGEKLRFTFVGGRPSPVEVEGFKILDAGIRPNPDSKTVLCGFQFLDDRGGRTLQSVRVEDVTEEVPILLVNDLAPKLENKRWSATTEPFDRDNPAIKWVFHIADTVRVYRFTIVTTDGQKVVLHQAAMVPAWVKGVVRAMFGEKY